MDWCIAKEKWRSLKDNNTDPQQVFFSEKKVKESPHYGTFGNVKRLAESGATSKDFRVQSTVFVQNHHREDSNLTFQWQRI